MKKKAEKRFWLIRPVNVGLMIISLLCSASLYFVDPIVCIIVSVITVFLVILSGYKIFNIQKDLYNVITKFGNSMTDSKDAGLINFPMPVLIINDIGEIIWYNNLFRTDIINNEKDIFGYPLKHIMKNEVSELLRNKCTLIKINEKYFDTYCLKTVYKARALYAIYFSDVTELEEIKLTSERKQPAVMTLVIDNYEETIGSESNAETSRLINDVREEIQKFADSTTCLLRRLSHDRYLLVMEHGDLEKIIAERFSVLDKVRNIAPAGRPQITLSIGVALVTDTLEKAEHDARQALDMALGRGGDQAAVKSLDSGYDFFGGFSKGVEKRTKVKTRIVASAMIELIKSSDNVLIMGHKFADLDSLGSAIGLAKAVKVYNQKVSVVLDSRRTLANTLVERLVNEGLDNVLVLPEFAIDYISNNTLLIIVDTHILNLLESQEIYNRCKQTIVIDHHRKMVNHITDAVIFYHEPFASSASEMVTELVQYFSDKCKLDKIEADALLSGITLDTKNFVVKTGVRTFEAAAYLKRCGADTIEVRRLFASTMDSYQRKARLVSSAEIYEDCAISICDFISDDLRIVAPQAADELLNINNVKASFVIYEDGDIVNVSARSMGDINVQLVMEKMGGGGHHTMAGTQISNSTADKVRQQLLEILDSNLDVRKV